MKGKINLSNQGFDIAMKPIVSFLSRRQNAKSTKLTQSISPNHH